MAWVGTQHEQHYRPTDDLPAERGSGRGRGLAEVLGWTDEPPLAELHAIVDGTSVAEADEVERPDVHDCLQPLEFVVGRLDVSAVGVDGSVDPLLVRSTWVPGTRAPDQVREVGEARSAPRRLPVDRDRSLLGQDGVIGGVEEIAVQQPLGKAVTVVSRAHLHPEALESFSLGSRDLRIDGVEEREGGEEVLTRGALTAGVLTTRSTRAASGIVVRQRWSRPRRSPIIANFAQLTFSMDLQSGSSLNTCDLASHVANPIVSSEFVRRQKESSAIRVRALVDYA